MTRKRATPGGSRGAPAPALPEIVRHPRYGSAPIPSGTARSPEEIRASFWQYTTATIFPETAIDADVTRQHFTVFPRSCYVDILKGCRDCGRSFIFFAKEQKYWYEVLGFYIDADCIRCPSCRRSVRELRTRMHRYAEAIGHVAELGDSALAALIDDYVVLWTAGIMKDEQRLRRLRNLARRRLPPTSKAMKQIERAFAELSAPPPR